MQRRTLWCLTWLGAFCVALFLAAPAVWWFYCGESFLSLTERRPAEILVVEGWIGRDGVRAAATEFERGVYRYVVTSGGVSESEGWTEGGWSYAEGAQQELIRSGVPEAKIIVAPAMDVERQRTYESALAVWRKLQSLSIKPKSINIFTLGPHARRSRLVFAKVEGSETRVGVISWTPSCNQAGPWWRRSNRAKELLTETVGYLFEALLNSGRSPQRPWHEEIRSDEYSRVGGPGCEAIYFNNEPFGSSQETGNPPLGYRTAAVLGRSFTGGKSAG